MAHLHFIEDADGDVVDHIVFCSDFCHQGFCWGERRSGEKYQDGCEPYQELEYGGWNGCEEISQSEPCANCGDMVQGLHDEDGNPAEPVSETDARRVDRLKSVR